MADKRLPTYLSLPLIHHSVMIEPMLGFVNLRPYFSKYRKTDGTPLLEGVSVGGESGPDARPCDFAWVLDAHMQCVENGVAFSYHQTGARLIKGGKEYLIPRENQHEQAHRAGLDYNGTVLVGMPGE
jgi:protein gp37